MAVFKNTEEMYKVLGDLWNYIIFEVKLGEKLKDFDITVKFIIKEPQGYIWIAWNKLFLVKRQTKMPLLPWSYRVILFTNIG